MAVYELVKSIFGSSCEMLSRNLPCMTVKSSTKIRLFENKKLVHVYPIVKNNCFAYYDVKPMHTSGWDWNNVDISAKRPEGKKTCFTHVDLIARNKCQPLKNRHLWQKWKLYHCAFESVRWFWCMRAGNPQAYLLGLVIHVL